MGFFPRNYQLSVKFVIVHPRSIQHDDVAITNEGRAMESLDWC